ncbi:MAG: HAMP domain-containing protein [Deltaproteobacteria bacterium]|nr:HAMP domain-containing protein [Deltaproteobacteria bacterium]MBN2687785.1 HAMP domain-containing protein [Deltaproteobacteria bacterium]
MKGNLFYKIFGTYIIIILLAVAIVGFQVTGQIKARQMAKIESDLITYTGMIDQLCTRAEVEAKLASIAKLADARITLIDREGNVLADSEAPASEMDNHLNRTEIQEARVKGKGTAIRYSHTIGIDTLYVAVPMMKDSQITGYVRLARPLHEIKKSLAAFNILIFQSFALVGVVSFIIAFIFSSRLVSPIQEMEQFTRKLRDGDMSGMLLIDSSDEMGRLARNINYIVTELQEKVRLADEERGKLEAAFASMTDGVLVLDNQGRIEALNNSFKSLFKTRRRDIVGRTPLEAFRNIELEKAIDRFKATGLPVAEEIMLGGAPDMILDVSISSIHGLPKGEEKMMIVFHDVTRLKKLEKMRVDFVANVTHEIKTPLTAILGFIETLQEGAIDDKDTARKFLQTIRRHAERLNRLVDDLLFISNIELGETRLFFESVALGGIMESVLSMIDQRVREKGLVLTKDIPDDLPPLRADRDRLNQILLNILDNAVKFTPEKEKISVTARLHDNKKHVIVTIADTGIGIPKSEISRLGERFYRVDKTRSRELGGTGLGLSIVKHLMKAHGGEIGIESRLGGGTTVSLSFPVYISMEE